MALDSCDTFNAIAIYSVASNDQVISCKPVIFSNQLMFFSSSESINIHGNLYRIFGSLNIAVKNMSCLQSIYSGEVLCSIAIVD